MKFTLSWLKDHLETNATLADLVDKMIWIGLEVGNVTNLAEAFSDFTVVELVDAKPHPDADKLQVCQVNTGAETLEVVCGAPNARSGMKGVFAPVGSTVPGINLKLKKAKIRGVQSNGMLLSERELGLSDEHEGIIELSSDAKVGDPAASALGLDDPMIDLEVTPNRPDTLAVAGIARDLAAANMGMLKTIAINPTKGAYPSPVNIGLKFEVGTEDACPLFAGRVIRGLKNSPSPDWLQRRLKAIDLHPINTLVDITNFISYDLARPLHVYDAAKLRGQIHARLGRKDEEFVALDGETYKIYDDMCVIADDSGVIALGGVMGSMSTASTNATTDVFIESAYFDPLRTARTGRRTGIESDARYRFERGSDPTFIVPGLELASQMILDMCGGEPSEIFVAGAEPKIDKVIDFDLSEIKRLTGLEIRESRSIDILNKLGFETSPKGASHAVRVPPWRPDIEGSACLVEEVARIHGFDKLPSVPMSRPHSITGSALTPSQARVQTARRALAARGLTEAITWTFVGRKHAALFGGGGKNLTLDNPISSELDTMRPSILPGLIGAVRRNVDRGIPDLGLFEVGPIYSGNEPSDQFTSAASVRRGAADGPGSADHWAGGAPPVTVFDVKADVLAVLEACGAPISSVQIAEVGLSWYHPGRSGAITLGPKTVLAVFGELHPRVLNALDIVGPLVGFEIHLDALPLPKAKATKTKPALDASDLPLVERDFAFVVDTDIAAATLMHAAKGADKSLITDVALFDVFEGDAIGQGKKSLAITVTLHPRKKTLTDSEIDAVSTKVIGAVEKATGGVLRS